MRLHLHKSVCTQAFKIKRSRHSSRMHAVLSVVSFSVSRILLARVLAPSNSSLNRKRLWKISGKLWQPCSARQRLDPNGVFSHKKETHDEAVDIRNENQRRHGKF